MLATPVGKQPRGLPRTRWSEYITNLAWSRLSVTELSEVAEKREVFQDILGLLSL